MTEPNALIAFPNYVEPTALYTPSFSGGLWSPSAPLSNLYNARLAYKARSLDCVPENTQFTVTLGTPRNVQVVVIPKHNLSLNATVTITLYDANGSVVYTSTADAFPALYPWGSLTFGDPHWFDCKMTPEEWAQNLYPVPVMLLLPETKVCSSVQFQFSDPDNAAGYIEISRPFIAPGWQPSINFNVGSSLGVIDSSVETVTMGMASIFDQRTKQRTFQIEFPILPQNEAFSNAFDMQMRLGRSGQVFVCLDPTDTSNFHRISCLMTAVQLSPIKYAAFGYSGLAYTFREVVA